MRAQTSTRKVFFWCLFTTAILALLLFLFTHSGSQPSNEMEGTLISSGESRSYLLYVPDSVQPGIPVPLVITLHGFGSTPEAVAHTSRWNDLADQYGFIVAYPQGYSDPAYWHSYGGEYEMLNSDLDVQFISDLIDQLEVKFSIDPARIYANGVSMGGGMSLLLLCKLSGRIAAAGGVAGAYSFPLELCQPSRPVPFIAFHGTDDNVVPYEGEELSDYGFTYPNIPQFMQNLAVMNQCQETVATPQDGVICLITYTRCTRNAEVILYTVHGGGHAWPGDPSGTTSMEGMITQQIDAAPLMWEFFDQHPMTQD